VAHTHPRVVKWRATLNSRHGVKTSSLSLSPKGKEYYLTNWHTVHSIKLQLKQNKWVALRPHLKAISPFLFSYIFNISWLEFHSFLFFFSFFFCRKKNENLRDNRKDDRPIAVAMQFLAVPYICKAGTITAPVRLSRSFYTRPPPLPPTYCITYQDKKKKCKKSFVYSRVHQAGKSSDGGRSFPDPVITRSHAYTILASPSAIFLKSVSLSAE
jgi:hypothetical protein